jgi:hypothetical protein
LNRQEFLPKKICKLSRSLGSLIGGSFSNGSLIGGGFSNGCLSGGWRGWGGCYRGGCGLGYASGFSGGFGGGSYGKAFLAVGNGSLALFADVYFIAAGFQLIKDFYAFPHANGA